MSLIKGDYLYNGRTLSKRHFSLFNPDFDLYLCDHCITLGYDGLLNNKKGYLNGSKRKSPTSTRLNHAIDSALKLFGKTLENLHD